MWGHHHHEHQYHHHDKPQFTWEEERRVKAPGELHLSLCWSSTAKVTWGGRTLKVLIVWIFDCEKTHSFHELTTWDKDTSTYLRTTMKCALKFSKFINHQKHCFQLFNCHSRTKLYHYYFLAMSPGQWQCFNLHGRSIYALLTGGRGWSECWQNF